MQAVQDYSAYKAQLEEKVANLKREREVTLREVESLGLKVAVRELERQARALEGELESLKGKRMVLEQKLASLDASSQFQQKAVPKPIGQ